MIRVIGLIKEENQIEYMIKEIISYSDTNKYPQSRIHTDAKSSW